MHDKDKNNFTMNTTVKFGGKVSVGMRDRKVGQSVKMRDER